MNERINPVKTISHACNQCGKCCRYRGDIYLTPLNVLQASKHLGMTCKSFLERFCECDKDDFAGVHLKARGQNKECVFLYNSDGKSKCAIYPVRPRACYLFPLKAHANPNVFTLNEHPFCSKSSPIPVEQFVDENSNSRHRRDTIHLDRFIQVTYIINNNPNIEKNKMLTEYLFCNNTEYEMETKFNRFLV